MRISDWSSDVCSSDLEIFYPAGPFAILPMLPGNRSAIVWSVKAEDAPAILDLPDRALAAEIEKRMGGFLGAIALAGPRASYRLGLHHAATITAARLALVGDAEHGLHQIAGPGLDPLFRQYGSAPCRAQRGKE